MSNQNVIGLKRKNNRATRAACVKGVCLPYSAKQQGEIAKLNNASLDHTALIFRFLGQSLLSSPQMISCWRSIILGATFFDSLQKKIGMVVFCLINTIPVKEYRERDGVGSGRVGGGGGYQGMHVKMLNKNFLSLN